MSAIPQKKICWNCEGNVARDIDNCPYCGVYLHGSDTEQQSFWGPGYRPDKEVDSAPPSAFYTSPNQEEKIEPLESDNVPEAKDSYVILTQLRQDIFPSLFLMAGSIFFLFGIVLFLFSHEGKFTLQWDSQYWVIFMALSVPLIYAGWRFLEKLDPEE